MQGEDKSPEEVTSISESGELSEEELEQLAGGTDAGSLSDISQEQQLKMQMVMERMTKADSAASNISKKMFQTAQNIIQNMK